MNTRTKMRSIEIPAPPKFLLVVVVLLTMVSFTGLLIGEHYRKEAPTPATPTSRDPSRALTLGGARAGGTEKGGGPSGKRYRVRVAVRSKEEGKALLDQWRKKGMDGVLETKESSIPIRKGYVVQERFAPELAKTAAAALKINDFIVAVEPGGRDQVVVRVGGIFADKAQGDALVAQLRARGYLFKVQPYEQTTKKVSYGVMLKGIDAPTAERLAKEQGAKGYPVEKQEER